MLKDARGRGWRRRPWRKAPRAAATVGPLMETAEQVIDDKASEPGRSAGGAGDPALAQDARGCLKRSYPTRDGCAHRPAAVRAQPGRRRARRQLGEGLLDVAARRPPASRRAGDHHERAYHRADRPGGERAGRSPGTIWFVDLDLSDDNLPPGTRLAVGPTLLEITAVPHKGCKKFAARSAWTPPASSIPRAACACTCAASTRGSSSAAWSPSAIRSRRFAAMLLVRPRLTVRAGAGAGQPD